MSSDTMETEAPKERAADKLAEVRKSVARTSEP
jgi:hypothetical protein